MHLKVCACLCVTVSQRLRRVQRTSERDNEPVESAATREIVFTCGMFECTSPHVPVAVTVLSLTSDLSLHS